MPSKMQSSGEVVDIKIKGASTRVHKRDKPSRSIAGTIKPRHQTKKHHHHLQHFIHQQHQTKPLSHQTPPRQPSPPPSPPSSPQELLLFDREWILCNIHQLNKVGDPKLSPTDLQHLRDDLVHNHLHSLLDLPLSQRLLDEASPVLCRAVCEAKISLPPRTMAQAPILGQFLNYINGFIQARNAAGLADYIILEPPFGDLYSQMIQQLKAVYPRGKESALEAHCTKLLVAAREGEGGSPWTTFIKFMVQYLGYLRDVSADASKYLETYEHLSELHQRANSALGHGTLGHLILPIVINNARCVCRLAIGLDKQPELIAHLKSAAGGGDDGAKETLPERAANILRTAFTTCLNDRASSLSKDGKPEGKKKGIYTIANLCLKILFQCRKTRNATQIFENIFNLSPPLSAYPKSQRVTYLYYLGRFLWQNSHFHRAQVALQYAYDECPVAPECIRQRRHILVYLVASNIVLGRFPSQALLSQPEAQGFAEHFLPVCYAIRSGDLASFRQHLDYNSPHAPWFLHFRILLQLRNRCEVLVWRSLIRKTWILNGTRPTLESRVTPQVDLNDIVAAFALCEARDPQEQYIHPEFRNMEGAEDLVQPATDERRILAVESKISSLIDQGFLNGFISHTRQKFAITGTKAKGGDILAAGFPSPWSVIDQKVEDDDVPGWKKHTSSFGGAPFGPGMTVNLSGARPVGAF